MEFTQTQYWITYILVFLATYAIIFKIMKIQLKEEDQWLSFCLALIWPIVLVAVFSTLLMIVLIVVLVLTLQATHFLMIKSPKIIHMKLKG